MTDLERKLAETLREQAGAVTPNLAAAWAEQQRRQRRPPRRRLTVVIAPLAAVLVVLTSVLLATQLNRPSAPPANPGGPLVLARPVHRPMSELRMASTPVSLTNFAGQTDAWTSYAFTATVTGSLQFCVAAVPRGAQLSSDAPQYGMNSPVCVALGGGPVRAGYVGEGAGPLPSGKAVYLATPQVDTLRMFNADGDLSLATMPFGALGADRVFVTDVSPGSPPVRFEVNPVPANPASR
ncbi:hypothetical protein [Amycolatopsis sp. NPDC051061]|uniref:hypothetical protein n=1 Tax=Amycolatopsis sp. NPDC051061 TaxID=3155042 RepID=UPI00343652B1